MSRGAKRTTPAAPPGNERVDFLDHVRAALAHVPAIPRTGTQPGTADDELHAALPQDASADAIAIIEAGRQDPRYPALDGAITADPQLRDLAVARLQELAGAHEGFDLTTPYAEDDAESGQFIAAAMERGLEAAVLLAAIVDHTPDGMALLASESSQPAQRAANDRLLGRISEREGTRLTGPAAALHRYLSARRADSAGVDAAAAALFDALDAMGRSRRSDPREWAADPHAWADEAFEFLLSSIEQPGAYRRAELKAPAVLNYMGLAIHPELGQPAMLSLDQPPPGASGADASSLGTRLPGQPDVASQIAAGLELGDLIAAAGLSQREHDVLQLLVEDLTQVEIAHRFGISPSTVGVHVMNLRKKLPKGRPPA